jgi:hypothetical protein
MAFQFTLDFTFHITVGSVLPFSSSPWLNALLKVALSGVVEIDNTLGTVTEYWEDAD